MNNGDILSEAEAIKDVGAHNQKKNYGNYMHVKTTQGKAAHEENSTMMHTKYQYQLKCKCDHFQLYNRCRFLYLST